MLCKRIVLYIFISLFVFSLNAARATPLPPEAAEICLDDGRKRGIFPKDITYDDLMVKPYFIDSLGTHYTVWVVSTQRQRPDVEFGWLSVYAPTNTVLQSSRTRSSYEDTIRMLEWEQTYGCSYFWPAALKARYYHELWGDESRITYPNENEISESEAIAIALQTLMEDAGVSESLLEQLLFSTEFYQDADPNDSVQSERFWGITFRENNPESRFMSLYAVVIDGLSGIPEYSIDYSTDEIIKHQP